MSFCLTGGRPLFLDTLQDRYFCLSDAAEASFMALVENKGDRPDPAGLQGLVDQGIIAPTTENARPKACRPPPQARASLLDPPFPSFNPVKTVLAALDLVRAKSGLKMRGLAGSLNQVRDGKARLAGAGHTRRLNAIVAAFARTGYFVAAHDQCLIRSIAVAGRMVRSGLPPELVLGVQLKPFRAHCWVQFGDLLVNDRPDVVSDFTPILVI